jgi:sigma-70-like protein
LLSRPERLDRSEIPTARDRAHRLLLGSWLYPDVPAAAGWLFSGRHCPRLLRIAAADSLGLALCLLLDLPAPCSSFLLRDGTSLDPLDLRVAGGANASDCERDYIIEHYGYLITKTRQRIIPSVPTKNAPGDLEQEGRIALVRAVDQFDPSRNTNFESYAISMLRGAMLEYLRQKYHGQR